ncbi:MAG: MBL fold metallo-hydrolase [Planctomycetota bacterium]
MPEAALAIRVLASGSTGNCSLVTIGSGVTTRAVLIDLGLSPRRTRRLLAESGVREDQIDAALITHFDRDHCHPGWANADLGRTRVVFHHTHGTPAHRILGSASSRRSNPIGASSNVGELRISTARTPHDDEGTTAFRLETQAGSLGYATDLGRVTGGLIAALRGVGTLAIESNYCPAMQAASGRPAFLKDRITGGRGHLSNEQAAAAARQIGPVAGLVLLHLSQQCNTPEVALAAHEGLGLVTTVSHHIDPTPWIQCAPTRAAAQPLLFEDRSATHGSVSA